MKEIKNYLPFYLGCEMMYGNTKWTLFGVHTSYYVINYKDLMLKIDFDTIFDYDSEHGKPIFRPLSDLSKDEYNKVAELLGYPKPYKFYDKQFFKWFWEGEGNENVFRSCLSC